MAITLVQSQEVTASLTWDFSVGNHTVSAGLRLNSDLTSGNVFLITVDIRTQKPETTQNSYPDYMPTSGNYNATLNSSTWNNLGSYSTTGMDGLFTFNNAEGGLGDRYTCYAFWTDQLSGSFNETINVQFYGPASGLFYGGKVVISATEWSGVDGDDISFLQNYTEADIDTNFSETVTVSLAEDDLVLVNHAIDDDGDDDSTVTIAGASATKIHSTSVSAIGNLPDTLRSESYYHLSTGDASSATVSYDADGGTDQANENKVMYVMKLAAVPPDYGTANYSRRALTGIGVNGMPCSIGGHSHAGTAIVNHKEVIESTKFVFSSGMSLPHTSSTDPIPIEYFERGCFRVYNPSDPKYGSFRYNVQLEWAANYRPSGEDLTDPEESGYSIDDLTWQSTWLQNGSQIASQSEITEGIHIYYILEDTLVRGVAGDGPYFVRVSIVAESGQAISSGESVIMEFLATTHSMARGSNPYSPFNVNISRATAIGSPLKRRKLSLDRF